jgi:hypothetical protein
MGNQWVHREIAVAGHLARAGCRVLEPTTVIPAGPHEVAGGFLSFWKYAVLGDADSTDGQSAKILREVHAALEGMSVDLPSYDPARECALMLDAIPADWFIDGERRLLDGAVGRLDVLNEATEPAQWLHGDATIRNIRTSSYGPVLCDFEDTFRGPPLWDVASMVAPWWVIGDTARCQRFARSYFNATVPGDLTRFVHARIVHSAIWSAWAGGPEPSASRLRRLAWLRAAAHDRSRLP